MKPNDTSPSPAVYSSEPEDFCYIDINIPCQVACPAFTNIPSYIRYLFEKHYGRSYEVNRLANILPGILGRICSRPCEDKCRHGERELGEPVNICHIKRASADLMEKDQGSVPDIIQAIDKKIAIIGSGPAGLAAAHDLASIGATVTIFEAFDKPGGMLEYGIPEFRLPRHIVKAEIDRILSLGVQLKTNVRVGLDIPVDDLLQEHDCVLLAAGCYQSNTLNVPGEELPDVYSGLEFMIDVCRDQPPPIGERVLVLGAGFTAFDCARSALRMGAKDVRICLRRTENDLVVTKDEILETKIEGVKIESLMVCRRIIGDTKIENVEFARTVPGDMQKDGKRKISLIEGSEFNLAADTVIVATGQKPLPLDLPGFSKEEGPLTGDGETYHTPVPGLYMAGDYLSGASTVIEAIAMGRRAAEKIARDLTGSKFREKAVRMEDTEITDRERSWDFLPRKEIPTIQPVAERFSFMNKEVETGYNAELAFEESKRCYLCYLHYEIDISRCIYCRYCIDVAPRDCIKLVDQVKTNEVGAITGFVETNSWEDVNAVVIDNSRCIRCGDCVRVCPVDCISVTKVELVERMLPGEGDND